uniref:Uncharacterized protein n=1 Tax=Rhizophora mucronata TaxID=61149 RepID=A0A2P2P0X9_RHIMU
MGGRRQRSGGWKEVKEEQEQNL